MATSDKQIQSSGDAADDAVALTQVVGLLLAEIDRLNKWMRGYSTSYITNDNWHLIMKMVLDGDMGPQQALGIIKKRAISSGFHKL